MSHVFISYSKKNKDYARRLADYLLEHGFDVWIDDRIDYGENWLDTMFQAVVECAACVVIMTPEAHRSRWVQREVAWADEREKQFFPVLLDGENWPIFVLTQYVDVRGGRLPDSTFVRELSEYAPCKAAQGTDISQQAAHVPEPHLARPISPEAQRLLDIMLNPNVPPPGRAEAGRHLAELGDPRPGVGLRADGLPDINWVEIPKGKFIFGDESENNGPVELTLPTFWIARYPITYQQFQAFIDAPDGFERDEWWARLTPKYQKQEMAEQYFKYANHPRDSVSWYQAVAFCRWLSAKLDVEVTLPTEQQWEKGARGTDGREYPYKGDFDVSKGNTAETGIGQTSAVGVFPEGASPYGVLDLSGNVWEWCLNEYEKPKNTGLGGSEWRVLRGGAWYDFRRLARCAFRFRYIPLDRDFGIGFRVVCGVSP